MYRLTHFEFNASIRNDSNKSSNENTDVSRWNCDGEILSVPSIRAKY